MSIKNPQKPEFLGIFGYLVVEYHSKTQHVVFNDIKQDKLRSWYLLLQDQLSPAAPDDT